VRRIAEDSRGEREHVHRRDPTDEEHLGRVTVIAAIEEASLAGVLVWRK
jgi:hypothetical protein